MSETNGTARHAGEGRAGPRAYPPDHPVSLLAGQLGERYWPAKVRLDDYEVYAGERQAHALREARAFAAAARANVEAGNALVLYGTHGTGKDFLLAACLYAACRAGFSAGWADALDYYGSLRDAVASREPKEPIIGRLVAPRVLGLSDPLPSAGCADDYSLTDLRRLIDRRDRAGKVTWLSVNADATSLPAVAAALKSGDAAALAAAYRAALAALEKALSGGVWSRLSRGAVTLPLFWQDYRKRKPKESVPCTTESTAPTATPTTAGSAPRSTSRPPTT